MRDLEGRSASGARSAATPADEVVDVGHLGEHVVAEDELGLAALVGEPLGELRAEELGQRRHAARDRRFGDVQRGFDAEHRNALWQEMLEQVAVVRSHFDDEALAALA